MRLFLAHHRSPYPQIGNERVDSPQYLERLNQWSDEHNKSHIVTIEISEVAAEAIVKRLWPGEGLLGATCGHGFFIVSEEQAPVVNEILVPHIHINFNLEKHEWMMQTWPVPSK